MDINDNHFGKYHILDELGRGGFATVYRAIDTTLDREVALKVLDPLLMRDTTWVVRFRREARTVAALKHPHIVTIFEINEVDGRLYLVMELASGGNLADHIARSTRLGWEPTLSLLKPICEALDYAHEQGVVHRDLKPENVLLDPRSGPLLTDFGFARLLSDNSMSLSLSGGILGTPAYVAPEIWELDVAAAPADIYALGCITYEMLVGQALFSSNTPMQAVRAHAIGPQYPTAWPNEVPVGIEVVLNKALAREARDRYATALTMWHALADLESAALIAEEARHRAEVAAQWQAETEAAITAGEWSIAKMMAGRWLAAEPKSEKARAAQAMISGQLSKPTHRTLWSQQQADSMESPTRTMPAVTAQGSPNPSIEQRRYDPQVQTSPQVSVTSAAGFHDQSARSHAQTIQPIRPGADPAITQTPTPSEQASGKSKVPLGAIIGLVAILAIATVGVGGFLIMTLVTGRTGPLASLEQPVALAWPSQTRALAPTSTLTPTPTRVPPTPTLVPTPTPVPPPLTGSVLFVSDRDSDEKICLMTVSGSATPMCVSNSKLDYAPQWMSDGRIMFLSKRSGTAQIYTMSSSGSDVRLFADARAVRNLAVASTGDRLAFVDRSNTLQWASMTDGKARTIDISAPSSMAWSPDGKRLAAIDRVYRRDEGSFLTIQIIDVSTNTPQIKTILETKADWGSYQIAWSPDGEWLAFPYDPDGEYPMVHAIYKIRSDGSGMARIGGAAGSDNTHPQWSPDGTQLLFVATAGTHSACDNSVIYTVSATGTDLKSLTDSAVESYQPVWAPDGRTIAYVVYDGSQNDIYVMNADGNNKQRRTDSSHADEYAPMWSSDGSRLVFASSQYTPRIYELNLSSTRVRPLTSDGHFVVHNSLTASSSGRSLVFTREFTFSSRQKSPIGSNTNICSSEEVVITGMPVAGAVYQGGEGGIVLSRQIHGWADEASVLLYRVWKDQALSIWNAKDKQSMKLSGIPDEVYVDGADISPDGKTVAYTAHVDDSRKAYTVQVPYGAPNRIAADDNISWGEPRFSPDGERLLLQTSSGLIVLNLNGVIVASISTDSFGGYEGIGTSNSINSKGEYIIFPRVLGPAHTAGIRSGDRLLAIDGAPLELHPDEDELSKALRGTAGTTVNLLIERDGRELGFDVKRAYIPNRSLEDYTWMPDSKSVAYELWQHDGLEGSQSLLFTHNTVTREERFVTSIAGDIHGLSTSWDGLWLVYQQSSEGNQEIWAVPTAGGAPVNLSNHPANDHSPVWIP